MTFLKSAFTLALCLFPLGAQPSRLAIAPFAIAKSVEFPLKKGEALILRGSAGGNPEFSIDCEVYTADHDLIAKDDEDQTTDAFSFQATQDGVYYVVIRNTSGVAGFYTITTGAQQEPRADLGKPDYAQVRIFYATDRQQVKLDNGKIGYGTELSPGDKIALGTCLVSVPRDHKMGELEGPSILRLEFKHDPAKHVVLLRVEPESDTEVFKRLNDRVQHSLKREALVFIHGFNTTFEDAARRTAQIVYDLGFDGAPILYSWPSQGKLSSLDYNKDGRNVEITVSHLKTFLFQLSTQTNAKTIHLVAHSMGNRALTRALEQIASEKSGTRQPHFQQVVLMAPDVDAELFRRMAAAVRSNADRVTLYASKKDEALLLAQKYAGYSRAGQGGPGILVIPGIDTIDVSNVDTSLLGAFHQYYGDNRTILSDLFHIIRGEGPDKRFGLQPVQKGNAGAYWVFRPSAR